MVKQNLSRAIRYRVGVVRSSIFSALALALVVRNSTRGCPWNMHRSRPHRRRNKNTVIYIEPAPVKNTRRIKRSEGRKEDGAVVKCATISAACRRWKRRSVWISNIQHHISVPTTVNACIILCVGDVTGFIYSRANCRCIVWVPPPTDYSFSNEYSNWKSVYSITT